MANKKKDKQEKQDPMEQQRDKAEIKAAQIGAAPGGTGASPFADFTWFDRPGKRGAIGAVGEALQGMAAPFTGRDFTPSEVRQPDMANQWNQQQAKQKFHAWTKKQQGQELTNYEKKLLNIDVEKAPNDWELYRRAQETAKTRLGGSSFMGINEGLRNKYEATTEEEYLKLKKRFGKMDQDDYMTMTKKYLKRKGYAVTNSNAMMVLKNNKGNLNFLFDEEPEPEAPKKQSLRERLGI